MRFLKIFLVLLGLLVIAPAIAQTSQKSGIQISPLTYNYDVKPGESVSGKITIKNLNTTPLTYVTEKENFSGVSDDGAPSFSETEYGVTALADWIEFTSNKEGVIAPEQNVVIDFTVSVPVGAEPGGHYAAVFAKEIRKTDEGKTELGVASRVGTLILVSVPGETTKTGQITEFKAPKIVWKGPVDFSLKFKNTGTVHYDSPAKVALKSLIGKTAEVDMGTHTVIPQSSRNYEGKWTKKYPFGYYKATATAIDGDKKEVSQSAVVWAIPLIIVVPALVVIIIIILVIVYLKKHVRFVDAKKDEKTTKPDNTNMPDSK